MRIEPSDLVLCRQSPVDEGRLYGYLRESGICSQMRAWVRGIGEMGMIRQWVIAEEGKTHLCEALPFEPSPLLGRCPRLSLLASEFFGVFWIFWFRVVHLKNQQMSVSAG